MTRYHVVIPARYGSTRLPGKPLLEIAGKPMIRHTYERAQGCGGGDVIVATDDERIRAVVEGFGARACMTSAKHASGTDRIAEVAAAMGWPDDAIVVNLQGDEPLMPPELLDQVASALEHHPQAVMATLAVCLTDPAQVFDPNIVKVVTDCHGMALYFSRAAIPWKRDEFHYAREPDVCWIEGLYRHLGIYAYRVGFLRHYGELPQSPLERMESLEQLRVLWHGDHIAVGIVAQMPPAGVDTPEDLERLQILLSPRLA